MNGMNEFALSGISDLSIDEIDQVDGGSAMIKDAFSRLSALRAVAWLTEKSYDIFYSIGYNDQ